MRQHRLTVSDRESLLDAAAVVFAIDRGASTSAIAEAVGISRATLHRMFGTRDALLEAVCLQLLERLQDAFDRANVEGAEVLEVLDVLTENPAELGRAWAVLMVEPHTYGVARVAERAVTVDRKLAGLFARGQASGVIRADLPAMWLAWSFASQCVAMWWAVHDGSVAPREASRLVRITMFEGMLS